VEQESSPEREPKPSRGVLTRGTLIAALVMVGVGFGGAWVFDRYVLAGSDEDGADGKAGAPGREAGATGDAVSSPEATGSSLPGPGTVVPSSVPASDVGGAPGTPGVEDVVPSTVDGAAVALGDVALSEYQFRTRREGDPQKVFSWVEVNVELDGVVGDAALELDLKNCPNDADGRLVSPAGTMVLLWSERGSTRSWTEVQGSFPDTLAPLESLCAFRGEPARGVWRLRVGDSQESCTVLLRGGWLLFGPPTRPCPPPEAPAAP
jgi:hypothetical protein